MKITQVCTRYYPAIGGVEEYVKRFSEGLVKKGHEVTVFTTNLKHHFSKDTVESAPVDLNGVRIKRNTVFPLRFRKYAVSPRMPVDLLKCDFQVIHAHSFMYFCSDVSAIVSKIRKKPLVFNPYLSELGKPSFFGKFYRKTFGSLLMSAESVIVIFEYEKKLIREWGYSPKKIELIPPGVDIIEFEKIRHNIFKEKNIGGRVILFAGRLDYYKGIDTLIKSFKIVSEDIKDLTLVIVGPDFGALSELKKLACKQGIIEKVHFLGPLDRSDLISAYKNAFLFVLPSRYEAFGIVLIEAMAAGLPVIASCHSAIPSVVDEGKNALLFELDNYLDLADKILILIKDDRLYSAIVDCGAKKIQNNYLWEENLIKLEKLYNTLI